jgi:hypothetical protein
MPVILPTQRSGGLWFKVSPDKKISYSLSLPIKLGMVAHTCHSSYVGGINEEARPAWAKAPELL